MKKRKAQLREQKHRTKGSVVFRNCRINFQQLTGEIIIMISKAFHSHDSCVWNLPVCAWKLEAFFANVWTDFHGVHKSLQTPFLLLILPQSITMWRGS